LTLILTLLIFVSERRIHSFSRICSFLFLILNIILNELIHYEESVI